MPLLRIGRRSPMQRRKIRRHGEGSEMLSGYPILPAGEASKMGEWNYVVTVQKPTSVTHSCAGNFTGPQDRNIIIAKYTCIEIHLLVLNDTKLMLNVPTHGRIAALELFHPDGESQDFLLLVTESCKFCILQWDGATSGLITRENGSCLGPRSCRIGGRQIVIVDPDCRLIGFYLYGRLFKVICFNEGWKKKKAFNLRLGELQVLDIKFLYSCSKPMIVVLHKDSSNGRHVNTYVVDVEAQRLHKGPWSLYDLYNGAGLVIPVRLTSGGAIIIGEKTIMYHNGTKMEGEVSSPSIITAYARVKADKSRYLLSDSRGHLYSLAILKRKRLPGLKIEGLGETSVVSVSTICCPDESVVYVGSSYENSQLIEFYVDPHGKHPKLRVLKTYVSLGPIEDLCVVDLKGQREVFTCSEAYRDCFQAVKFSSGFNEMASLQFQSSIKDFWSLRNSTNNPHDTLVVNLTYDTRILQMDPKCGLVKTRIKGFDDCAETLFCSSSFSDQLVQVTPECVRLISSTSGKLLDTWAAPLRRLIILASGDAFQVLLATEEGWLVSVSIAKGYLILQSEEEVEGMISCLVMHQTRSWSVCSTMAAVGTSAGRVSIYHIPSMIHDVGVELEEEIIPHSVLLCQLEEVCYLFCSLKDGDLSTYVYNWKDLIFVDNVNLGTKRFRLRRFFSEGKSKVFAASDKPTIICSSNKKLIHTSLNVKGASDMCPSNSAAFPDSLAIAKEEELSVGTIIPDVKIRSVRLEEHAQHFCHQEQSRTFAICSNCQMLTEETGTGFVQLLDDHNCGFMSTHKLKTGEYGLSILSCSFTDDNNVYYCVGTAFLSSTKGRILVFIVKGWELKLVANKEIEGAVNRLIAYNGKLLAGTDQKILVYKWVLRDDGSHVLEPESGNPLLQCKQQGRVMYYNKETVTALEVLGDNYLGANKKRNLFTIRKDGVGDKGEQGLPVLIEYHLGEIVNQFRVGPPMQLILDCKVIRVPTLIFGTANGMIGVVASIPRDQYKFLNELQSRLTNLKTGVGGLSHKQWQLYTKKKAEFKLQSRLTYPKMGVRGFITHKQWMSLNKKKTESKDAFLDGDLIVSFLNLDCDLKRRISKKLNCSVEKICYTVKAMSGVL